MSISDKKQKTYLISSCVNEEFPVVSQIYHNYMFVGSSVSRKECDEVFLSCHICSFIENILSMVHWIFSITENMVQSFLDLPSDNQCYGNNVMYIS